MQYNMRECTVAELSADLNIAADLHPRAYDSAHLCCLRMCFIRGCSALPHCAAEQQSATLGVVLGHFKVTKYLFYEFEIGSHTSRPGLWRYLRQILIDFRHSFTAKTVEFIPAYLEQVGPAGVSQNFRHFSF